MMRHGTNRAGATIVAVASLVVSVRAAPQAEPKFDIADVHASAPTRNASMRAGVLREGRYELRQATMLDLISTAYGVDPEVVSGGPSWLEWDRFDVIARTPSNTTPPKAKLMLQSLLVDRFKLVIRKDTRPVQGFVLSMGRDKPKMSPADPAGIPGCVPQPPPTRHDGPPPQAVSCRNITMAAFAAALRDIDNLYLTGPVTDQTSLAGAWDFDLTWTDKRRLPLGGNNTATIFEAVAQQLGLRLESGKVPMPVIVVDHVNQKPTANSPEVAALLPPRPLPEFDAASIRPSAPDARPGGRGFMPGGRVEFQNVPLRFLINLAWDLNFDPDEPIPGAPKWLKPFDPAFDVMAKAPAALATASGTQYYVEDYPLMIRALLVGRFKMRTHYEDRLMDAYTLVALSPKLERSDPSTRTKCETVRSAASTDLKQGQSQMVATCRNVTMSQFAEQLPTIAPNYFRYPVVNATGIEGAWNFSFTFSPVPPNLVAASGNQGGARNSNSKAPGATEDPVGGASLFDVLRKQLGLRLEVHKRPEPVFIIDHIEEKPTDN